MTEWWCAFLCVHFHSWQGLHCLGHSQPGSQLFQLWCLPFGGHPSLWHWQSGPCCFYQQTHSPLQLWCCLPLHQSMHIGWCHCSLVLMMLCVSFSVDQFGFGCQCPLDDLLSIVQSKCVGQLGVWLSWVFLGVLWVCCPHSWARLNVHIPSLILFGVHHLLLSLLCWSCLLIVDESLPGLQSWKMMAQLRRTLDQAVHAGGQEWWRRSGCRHHLGRARQGKGICECWSVGVVAVVAASSGGLELQKASMNFINCCMEPSSPPKASLTSQGSSL